MNCYGIRIKHYLNITSTATLILFNQDLDLDNLAKILEESVRKNIG